MTRLRSSIPLLLAGLVGCTEPIKSSEVATSEMVAEMDVTCDGQTSVATALFTYGSGFPVTYVQLSYDDTLSAVAGGLSKEMSELVLDDLISYIASFELTEADTEFQITLERVLDEGAAGNTATLPPPFEITAPADAQSFSRGADDLTIAWEGAAADGDRTTLVIDGDCIDGYEELLSEDLGTVTIPAGDLVSSTGHETETCEVMVWVKRERSGELDPAFAGGTMSARQYRAVEILAEP